MMEDLNRREFLLTSAMFTASACGSDQGSRNQITSPITPSPYTLSNGARIVFQGDSITDSDHWPGTIDPNNAAAMGYGYPLFMAQHLLFSRPQQQLLFFNRARGGDTVPLLQARWQTDAIDLQPDLLSILVGINDFVANYPNPDYATIYEQNYMALIDTTLQALPNTKLVVLEPYLMHDTPVPEFQRRDAAARVAMHANAIFVPLQDMLNTYASEETPIYWVADQAHPTIAGSAAIANQWLKTVGLQ